MLTFSTMFLLPDENKYGCLKRVERDSLLWAVQAHRGETKAHSAHLVHRVCWPAGSLRLGMGKHVGLHVHIAEDLQHVLGRKCNVTLYRHKRLSCSWRMLHFCFLIWRWGFCFCRLHTFSSASKLSVSWNVLQSNTTALQWILLLQSFTFSVLVDTYEKVKKCIIVRSSPNISF